MRLQPLQQLRLIEALRPAMPFLQATPFNWHTYELNTSVFFWLEITTSFTWRLWVFVGTQANRHSCWIESNNSVRINYPLPLHIPNFVAEATKFTCHLSFVLFIFIFHDNYSRQLLFRLDEFAISLLQYASDFTINTNIFLVVLHKTAAPARSNSSKCTDSCPTPLYVDLYPDPQEGGVGRSLGPVWNCVFPLRNDLENPRTAKQLDII